MPASRTCSQCAAPLPDDAPQGLCPACLLKQGFNSVDATVSVSGAADTGRSSMAPDPMSIEQLAPYFPQLEIIELLGRGGMGVVYKARQRHLDRLVALKILPTDVIATPAFAERFTREAKALAHLSHPHIVTIHDFGQAHPAGVDPGSPTTPSVYYLLMEYVEGSNLRGLMKSLAPDQALAIVPQICEALQFAHEEGIVHRDIKPENILVDKKGRVKIADFGLAKLLQHAKGPADFTLTRPDKILGTLHYMAPEQLERPTEVDHRADIYSLGVVFYELLTGHLPLGRFALPSETHAVDARLDDVVLKALEREPEKRYQHASEVKTSVESLRSSPAVPAVPAAPAPAQAASRAGLETGAEPSAAPATQQRLSRTAIVGAVCGIPGLLGIALLVFAIVQASADSSDHSPTFWRSSLINRALLLELAMLVLSAASMTLLGTIAVVQIRRAPRQWYGLRLALFDALFCPLLVLDAVVCGVFALIFFSNGAPHPPAVNGQSQESLSAAPLLLGLGFWLPVIDVLIYWLFWRWLRIRPASSANPKKKATAPRLSKMAMLASICGVPALVGMILIISAAFSLHPMADDFGNTYWGPLWAQDELLWGLLTVGLFGGAMSLLGAMALVQIRRSPERLYGLRLALLEALLFPLLLIDTGVVEFLGNGKVLRFALSILALGFSVLVYWLPWNKLRVPVKNETPSKSAGIRPPTATPSPVSGPVPQIASNPHAQGQGP